MFDVSAIWNLYPADCRPARWEPLGSAGGLSGAQFWRLRARRGDLVLRQWPREAPTAEGLRFIHSVLEHAARRGIAFVPVPIRATTGESFVARDGYLWQLDPWMPGTADYETSPSPAKLRSALVALAGFHNAVADFRHEASQGRVAGGAPAIARRLAMLDELNRGRVHELAQSINGAVWPELLPLARQFAALLPAAIPRAMARLAATADLRLPLQPCLRDIWHDHILFTGDEVTGLVDFGAVDIDTPAADIARLLGSLGTVPFSAARSDRSQLPIDKEQDDPSKRGLSPSFRDEVETWQTGLSAYTNRRPLTPDEERAVAPLDASGTVLAGCNWLRWIYVEGRVFENQAQVIERFRRIVMRVERGAQKQ